MNRPPLEVADIIRSAGESFLEKSKRWITWQHRKVLLAILLPYGCARWSPRSMLRLRPRRHLI
jgi:hypothetical protein